MSREKQIAEMAVDINDCITEFVTDVGDVYIDDEATAQKMFDKGYRKIQTTDWLTKGISKEIQLEPLKMADKAMKIANENADLMCEQHKRAKFGAVREFAERLKEKTYPFPCATGVEYAVTIRAINDAVKEMVGDTE